MKLNSYKVLLIPSYLMKMPRRRISRLSLTIWRGESPSLFVSCPSKMELHLDVQDVGGSQLEQLCSTVGRVRWSSQV